MGEAAHGIGPRRAGCTTKRSNPHGPGARWDKPREGANCRGETRIAGVAGSGEAARVGALSFLKHSLWSHLLPPLHRRLHRLLDLSNSWLCDGILDAVTNCSNLRILGLRRNLIFGEIHPKLDLLSNLLFLRLFQNKVS